MTHQMRRRLQATGHRPARPTDSLYQRAIAEVTDGKGGAVQYPYMYPQLAPAGSLRLLASIEKQPYRPPRRRLVLEVAQWR